MPCACRPSRGTHTGRSSCSSCSRRHRCHGVLLGLDAAGSLGPERLDLDMTPLHDALDARLGGLNVEGAVVLGEELVLLQRGGKGRRLNARIRLRLEQALDAIAGPQRLGTEALVAVEEIELGGAGDVPYAFTDGAALPDGRMVFTAVAEAAADAYVDGPCRGAVIGIMDPAGRVERLEPLAARHKVEGIDAALEGGAIRALLVTDADDFRVPSALLGCEIRG